MEDIRGGGLSEWRILGVEDIRGTYLLGLLGEVQDISPWPCWGTAILP